MPAPFGPLAAGAEPLGEVWFQGSGAADETLLVKYLFTSEKLSIQVHPDDAAAKAAGYPRGKDEAWLILSAEPEAVIGVGLTRSISKEALRAAALDGSIETMVEWRPAAAGDILYSPAGTIHALGPGLTLIEIQQNVDLTYRLYDYGRPRELHLEAGIEAADPAPYRWSADTKRLAPERELLIEGPKFVVERVRGGEVALSGGGDDPVWLVPVEGISHAGDQPLAQGGVYLARGAEAITVPADAELLLAYAGAQLRRV